MIIADTNLIAYLLVQGRRTSSAKAVLQKDSKWAAPVLWRSEFRNVLMSYVRVGELSLDQVMQIMEYAETLMLEGEYQVQSSRVLALAARSRCSTYDCEFVSLAESLSLPLVTTDRSLLRAFPTIAVSMEDFVSRRN